VLERPGHNHRPQLSAERSTAQIAQGGDQPREVVLPFLAVLADVRQDLVDRIDEGEQRIGDLSIYREHAVAQWTQ
jgi:hypothetical protein